MASPPGIARSKHGSIDLQDLLHMLSQSLDALDEKTNRPALGGGNVLWHETPTGSTSQAKNIAKIRTMLEESDVFELIPGRRKRLKSSSPGGSEVLEHSVYRARTPDARIAIKVSRRWAGATGISRGLLEFRARVTRIPTTKGHGLSAEFNQIATAAGLLSIPPSLTYCTVADPDAPLFRFIDHDDISGVRQLLRAGQASIRDCDVFGWSVLHRAAWNCSAVLWQTLIAEGADIDCVTAAGSSFMLLQCGTDYHIKLQIALEAGADPTLLPGGQFFLANMSANAVRSVLRISQAYIDLTLREVSKRRTLLLAAAAATHNPDQALILRLLLRAGSDPQDCDIDGNTCLHLLLNAAQPGQPQCLEALAVLLLAGANPLLRNRDDHNAVDAACARGDHGSFQRDILCQALARSGCPIADRRFASQSQYTATFDQSQYALHVSSATMGGPCDLRTHLLRRLVDEVDCSGAFTKYRLHEAAVDRTLASHSWAGEAEFDILLGTAIHYLRLMVEGKRHIVVMTKDRLSYKSWIPYGRLVNTLQITEESELAALLEFDWRQYVDYEDLFISYTEGLIEHFEDFKDKQGHHTEINKLIEKIEAALPSRTELMRRQTNSVEMPTLTYSRGESLPKLLINTVVERPKSTDDVEERHDSMSPERKSRPLSIVSTPTEYYPQIPVFTEAGKAPTVR